MSFIFLYNKCYGGFGLTKDFINNFNVIYGENYHDVWDFHRDDSRLYELIKERGIENSVEEYCKLGAISYPNKYKGFISIHEYDGKETIYIDYNKYYISRFLELNPQDKLGISDLQQEIREYQKDKSYNGEDIMI